MKIKIYGRMLGLCLLSVVTLIASAAEKQMGGKPDPQMQAVLDELQALKPKPIETLTAREARQQPSGVTAVKALLQKRGTTSPEAVGSVTNINITSPAGNLPARIYTPQGSGPFPVVVYYHGGGWVLGDLDGGDSSARALANAANAIVVSADYRKGPENKFPAAHEDALAAYRWTLKNVGQFNGDPDRVAVAGESAGGNLAAAVPIMAREQGVPLPVYQVLIYPVAHYGFDTASYQESGDARPLNKAMMQWFFKQYLNNPQDGQSPYISLVDAPNLKGLPPATIIAAQIDPLRSEGKMYADKLQQAGVPVSYRNFDGVTHEFFGMGAVVDKAREAVSLAGAGLKGAFQSTTPAPTGREQGTTQPK